MFFRTYLTTLLQIFCEVLMLNFQVIFMSTVGPDDTGIKPIPDMNKLKTNNMWDVRKRDSPIHACSTPKHPDYYGDILGCF